MICVCPRCLSVGDQHFRTIYGRSVLCAGCYADPKNWSNPEVRRLFREDLTLAIDGFRGSSPSWTYPSKEIARNFGIRPGSVRSFRSRRFRKEVGR